MPQWSSLFSPIPNATNATYSIASLAAAGLSNRQIARRAGLQGNLLDDFHLRFVNDQNQPIPRTQVQHAARLLRLQSLGCTDEQLARIEGPAGVTINAINAPEIALSIAGGMVRAFNHGRR